MTPRRSRKGSITLFDYVRENQGTTLDGVIRNAIVRTRYRKRLPFKGELTLSDKRLVTIKIGHHWCVFTNDEHGMKAGIERGLKEHQMARFKLYEGIMDWAK